MEATATASTTASASPRRDRHIAGVSAELGLGTIGTSERCAHRISGTTDQKVDDMSPDDYTSDPSKSAFGIPGTPDDVPGEYGQVLADSDDKPSPASAVSVSEREDEHDLWRRQQALIEEDEHEGLKLQGFDAETIPEILDAMGDDAAEPLEDSPNGTSATGLWGTPEHGGFPERND